MQHWIVACRSEVTAVEDKQIIYEEFSFQSCTPVTHIMVHAIWYVDSNCYCMNTCKKIICHLSFYRIKTTLIHNLIFFSPFALIIIRHPGSIVRVCWQDCYRCFWYKICFIFLYIAFWCYGHSRIQDIVIASNMEILKFVSILFYQYHTAKYYYILLSFLSFGPWIFLHVLSFPEVGSSWPNKLKR